MSTIKEREKFLNVFHKDFDFKLLQKKKLLGEGGQGKVYSYCTNKKRKTETYCTAVKKIYIESEQSKYINDVSNPKALRHSTFIELASMQLVNDLVLKKICPNFILNYSWRFKSRTGVCDDIYPNVVYFFNEYIENSSTFSEWVKGNHQLDELWNAFFQIVYAIYTLQNHLNMTHLDLHADNIIVKKVQPGGYWKYTLKLDDGKENTYYVPNLGYIFYINDFGHAWVPNVFKSWFIRRRYKTKNVKRHFDLMTLFRSIGKRLPELFQKKIRLMIKTLRDTDKPFSEVILETWGEIYKNKPKSKLLDSFVG